MVFKLGPSKKNIKSGLPSVKLKDETDISLTSNVMLIVAIMCQCYTMPATALRRTV